MIYIKHILFYILIGTIGCGTSDITSGATGSVSVNFAPSSTPMDRIEITVGGTGIHTPIVSVLNVVTDTVTETTLTSRIVGIPVGVYRNFQAISYSSSNPSKNCYGSALVDILPKQIAAVNIRMLCDSTPKSLGGAEVNVSWSHLPSIDFLRADRTIVPTTGTVTLNALVSDDDDDPLTYLWTATSGSFTDGTSTSTIWSPDQTSGTVTVSFTASDPTSSTTDIIYIFVQ